MAAEIVETPTWEQWPGEPARWFERFNRFRLMGVSRSLLGTVRAEAEEKGSKKKAQCVPGSWAEAVKRWHWRERAAAWDKHEREQLEAERQARVIQLLGKEWDVALRGLEKATQMYQLPVAITTREETSENGQSVTRITVVPRGGIFGEAARVAEASSKIARLSVGIATDRSEHSGPNGAPISVSLPDMRELILKIYGDNDPDDGSTSTGGATPT